MQKQTFFKKQNLLFCNFPLSSLIKTVTGNRISDIVIKLFFLSFDRNKIRMACRMRDEYGHILKASRSKGTSENSNYPVSSMLQSEKGMFAFIFFSFWFTCNTVFSKNMKQRRDFNFKL